ncbi:glycosyltransferase family 4 protein [Candidatus Parcubacteria bacterium]|nr:glycosyltransferase family 4 protein [Candidatus Parcubacteria bacterium]
MSPKKILIFSLVYYPRFIGGAEVAIKEITDRLNPSEFEFHMVTLRLDKNLPKIEKIGNVLVHRVGFAGVTRDSSDSLRFPLHLNKYLIAFSGYWEAVRLHKQYKYDAIWSMMATYNSFAALFFKSRFSKVPFILTLQEGDPIDYIKKRVGVFYPMFKNIFTRANKIQTISNYLADWARDMGQKNPIEVVPNGVDTTLFTKEYSQDELNELKKKLGKQNADVFLITTSRLVVKNAVGDVVESLRHLPNNVKFLILGQGYQEEELKLKARNLGLERRVKFLGYIPHKEMPKYLKISDIFVRPSLSEGFGNSFIEAMAAGIPVIATPVGGIVDFIKNEETGLFAKVEDPESIATEVKRLISDENLRNKLIENGRKLAIEKYDWNLIARDMKSKVFDTI